MIPSPFESSIESAVESTWKRPDTTFEVPLRPKALTDFIGQPKVHEKLNVMIGAAKGRGETLGHILFYGPPGLGKTTLANIIAESMGTRIVVTSGPVIEKAGDLAGILTNLKEGDVLFIDEIHRLSRNIEEYLYPAVEDFTLDLMLDSGPAARSVQVKLNKFTLVGATTRSGLVSAPMRSRFAFTCRLDYYEAPVLAQIIKRSASILGVTIDDDGAHEVAIRSRGTPRIANNLLRWVRDFAQVKGHQLISRKIADEALTLLQIDSRGLEEMDTKILSTLIDHFDGGPAGLSTLAVSVGEEPTTLEEVYEPYLILQGLIKRTPKGRVATKLAYNHLGRPLKDLETQRLENS